MSEHLMETSHSLTETSHSLIEASQIGQIETVKLLLKKGVDLNLQDKNRFTALMWASYKGYIEIVRLLLEAGGKSQFTR